MTEIDKKILALAVKYGTGITPHLHELVRLAQSPEKEIEEPSTVIRFIESLQKKDVGLTNKASRLFHWMRETRTRVSIKDIPKDIWREFALILIKNKRLQLDEKEEYISFV